MAMPFGRIALMLRLPPPVEVKWRPSAGRDYFYRRLAVVRRPDPAGAAAGKGRLLTRP